MKDKNRAKNKRKPSQSAGEYLDVRLYPPVADYVRAVAAEEGRSMANAAAVLVRAGWVMKGHEQ